MVPILPLLVKYWLDVVICDLLLMLLLVEVYIYCLGGDDLF